MKLSKNEKKELLLSIFDAISPDFDGNQREILQCVKKIMKIDPYLGVDLWKSLILTYPEENQSSKYFSSDFMSALEDAVGSAQCYEIIIKDDVLKYHIYHEAGELSSWPVTAVSYFINIDKIQTAQELLQLMDTNRYLTTPWNDILELIMIDYDDWFFISPDGYDLLAWWIEKKVDNPDEKDDLFSYLIGLVDYIETE